MTEAHAIRVLYVEDDRHLARKTASYLESHGLEVHIVMRGDAAVAGIGRTRPDIVLLDLTLPGLDGLSVCRQIRERYAFPVIMVADRTEVRDRVSGLEAGADDYVTKPFYPQELLARIRAQVRRARGALTPNLAKLVVGPLVIDPMSRSAAIRGNPVTLTGNELATLTALARQPGRVLSREQLLRVLHGSTEEAFDRAVDVVVSRLRKKLEDNPRRPELVRTVRGAGYVLTLPGVDED